MGDLAPLSFVDRFDAGGYYCADGSCRPLRARLVRVVLFRDGESLRAVAVPLCSLHGELWPGERPEDLRIALRFLGLATLLDRAA